MKLRNVRLRERVLVSLDESLRRWDPARLAPPEGGWLRSIRAALGMTSRELARRVGVAEPAVRGAERVHRRLFAHRRWDAAAYRVLRRRITARNLASLWSGKMRG